MKNKKALSSIWIWILIILIIVVIGAIIWVFFSASSAGTIGSGSSIPQPPALPGG